MALATLSRLLLDLHTLEASPSLAQFREQVLKRLSESVPFTSAVWASGAMTPGGPDFHTVTLWKQPPQLLVDYEAIKHQDPLFVESAQSPGRAVRASARTSLPPSFMPFVARYRLEQAMSIMHTDPRSLLLTGLSLWRSSPTEPFTAEDAGLMEAAFPHLMEVSAKRLLADLGRFGSAPAPVSSLAAVDRRGRLHAADARFVSVLTREFPRWRGPELPGALHPALATGSAQRVVLTHITATITPHGDLIAVRVRARSAVDDLTPRQLEVVELGALGLNHKQIAQRLAVSPTTVRNHLAHAYDRLGVGNRVELATLLQRLR
ncbi:MAG: LuxR C-terminal-related transcriptional regulator [Vicinamibacterales bacterium]